MNNFKSIVAAAIGLLVGVQASAHDNFNYLNITAGGGLHTMRHNPSLGEFDEGSKFKPCFGGAFNVNYIHFFGKHFGLGTGLGRLCHKGFCRFQVHLVFDDHTPQFGVVLLLADAVIDSAYYGYDGDEHREDCCY